MLLRSFAGLRSSPSMLTLDGAMAEVSKAVSDWNGAAA